MAPQAYKTMVGAFVAGGIVLFTLGVILLGGGRLFSDSLEYTLYFDGSVSGLSIGAPVVFRGVPMGSVTQISLVANARDSNVTIPVTIRIDDRSFIRASGATLSESAQSEIIQKMVERGLRARLQIGSLITGQYRVELDFFPNTPMNFRSSNPDSEIPTVPSPIDTLQKTFASLPIDQIADSLQVILKNITEAVGNGQLQSALNHFSDAFKEARDLLADSGARVALEDALKHIDDMSKSIQKDIPAAIVSFQQAMSGIARASEKWGAVGTSADELISRDSPTLNELRRLIREATAAARSLHNFADMLERNPEALIKGRHGTR